LNATLQDTVNDVKSVIAARVTAITDRDDNNRRFIILKTASN